MAKKQTTKKVSGLYLMYCLNKEEDEGESQYIIELLYTLPGENRTYDDFEQEYGKENIDFAVELFANKHNCEDVEISSENYEYDKLPL